MQKLNFRPETTKGKVFTAILITALIGGGFLFEANSRANGLQDRLTQQETAFMKLADEFQTYKKANPEAIIIVDDSDLTEVTP
jgi:hypothetical protein